MAAEESDGAAHHDLDVIRSVLEEAPVTLAVLYGSHARGEARPGSDVDVAVSFRESLSSVECTRTRWT